MINKTKVCVFAIIITFFIGINFVNAAALALRWAVDQTIDLTTVDLNILAGSTAESMIVNSTTIVPTLSGGDAFTASTAVAGGLTVSPSTGTVISCNNSVATVLITVTAGTQVYTITPLTTPCHGGGGGGRINPPTTTTPVVTPPVTPPAHAGLYNFGTTTLKNGSKGEAVKELQRFLNATMNLGLVVDGKLGPKTIAVIKKWQKAHNLVADGLIGPKTKAKMNASVQ